MNLVDNIIKKIPDNLDDLGKARFIYIKLGELLEFDTTTIYNANDKIFEVKKNKQIDIQNLDTNLVNCYNWSNIYVQLLKKIGINAEMKDLGHAWVIFEIGDDIIYADATAGYEMDLARIKSNLDTDKFYLLHNKKTEKVSPLYSAKFFKKIDEIDRIIGYMKKKQTAYQKLESLKYEVSKIEILKDKVDYIFKHIDLTSFGFFEGNAYIKYVLNFCIDNTLLRKVSSIIMSKTLQNGEVVSIRCITVDDRHIINYYIFCKNKGIYSISKDKILKINQMGYAIENYRTIPGIEGITNFKRYNFSHKEEIRLKKENLYTMAYSKDQELSFDIQQKSR